MNETKIAQRSGSSGWTVVPESLHTADATALRRAYYAEVAGRYWNRPATEAEVDEGLAEDPGTELARPTGEFVVGRLAGVPAACGGIRLLDARTAELTRVYVDPRMRGTGGGTALLAALEDAARSLGAERIRLDTRTDLVEARALYAKHGYEEIPPYKQDPYAQHFFEKSIL
ncbi:GNAT family N-acetyltransferase [Streptomyces antimicrobicus]|uniref:GNAT family N-acetyltransferase n=1 Tax=Streptomyces antimicrobicus TaxID=2883108 RepID=A0ABS8B8X2_9ACTN|nr:GNAT family N-acetyltransferase [Streptomyces antimicrobicus]MCB5180999.1 GNAT family N-acetyltransferase [Streptomyces antimicrobicus]